MNGESALYLGWSYRIEVVAHGSGEIEFAHRFLIPASDATKGKGAMRAWYLARANEKILPRVERHAQQLATFVIDYVIVHELAHLIEANHTPRFWNVVRTHVPKMEQARAWLSENGQVLEEEI